MSMENAQDDGRNRERFALAAAFLLALVLRALYLFQIHGHPLFSALTGDPATYYARALGILSGAIVPDHAFFHSCPFYPYVLAGFAHVTSSMDAVRAAQALVGAVSVILIFKLGKLTLGRSSGIIAAFLAAIYVPFIFFEGELLEISLVLAFLEGTLILLVLARKRSSRWLAALAGVLLGLAALGKPNLLLFAPTGAIWLYMAALSRHGVSGRGTSRRDPRRADQTHTDRTRAGSRRRAAIMGIVFFMATGVTILPATIHNYRSSGDLIPVSSNGGINLFIGNHPGAPGVFRVPPEMRFDLRLASKEVAERSTGRPLSDGEVSDYWAGQAFRFARSYPNAWARQIGRKFVLFWNHFEIPNHYDINFVKRLAPVLRNPIGTFAVLAPLGILGLVLAAARRKRTGLLIAFATTFMVSVMPFFVTARYRLAIVPVLLVGAGFAVTEIISMFRKRSWKPLIAAGILLTLLTTGVNIDVIEFGSAQMHNTLGAILGSQGNFEAAAAEFELALDENPRDLSARYNAGLALIELERLDEAAFHLERAVDAHPRYFEAWNALAHARAGLGEDRAALDALGSVLNANPPAPEPLVAEARGIAEALLRTTASEETGAR